MLGPWHYPFRSYGRLERTLWPATQVVAFITHGFTFRKIAADECSLRLEMDGHHRTDNRSSPSHPLTPQVALLHQVHIRKRGERRTSVPCGTPR